MLIDAFAPRAGVVYDPFCGSGTTLAAAQKLGRAAYGMEISPEYAEMAVERFGKAHPGVAVSVLSGAASC